MNVEKVWNIQNSIGGIKNGVCRESYQSTMTSSDVGFGISHDVIHVLLGQMAVNGFQ